MASIKFSGLPVSSAPYDVASLLALAEVDAPFTSRKISLQQLRIALSNVDSAIDKAVMQDASGDAKMIINDLGTGAEWSLTTDDGSFVTAYMDVHAVNGFELVSGAAGGGSWVLAGRQSLGYFEIADGGGAGGMQFYVVGDNTGGNFTTKNNDTLPSVVSGKNTQVNQNRIDAAYIGGDGGILDTDHVAHTQAVSTKINDLGSVGVNQTLTISDGSHIKLTPSANITINVNTYSTNNAVRATIEVDNAGGHTITQGTGFVNQAAGVWAAFGTGLEVIETKSLSSGNHLVEQQFNTIA